MESNKPLRTHPKMTKVLLGQIDSLDKEGHSVEDIAATLNTTPEAVQRGIDKLIDRRRSEIRATPGGAFTVAAQKKTCRARYKRKPPFYRSFSPTGGNGGVVTRRTTAFGRLA